MPVLHQARQATKAHALGQQAVTLGGLAVAMPEGAFLQATADGEAKLVQSVLEAVGPVETSADGLATGGQIQGRTNGRHRLDGVSSLCAVLASPTHQRVATQ